MRPIKHYLSTLSAEVNSQSQHSWITSGVNHVVKAVRELCLQVDPLLFVDLFASAVELQILVSNLELFPSSILSPARTAITSFWTPFNLRSCARQTLVGPIPRSKAVEPGRGSRPWTAHAAASNNDASSHELIEKWNSLAAGNAQYSAKPPFTA